MKYSALAVLLLFCCVRDSHAATAEWNPAAAAQYLDQRASWWESWPRSQRDHDTHCISCHTMVPYALSRPKLRSTLKERDLPAPELSMLAYLRKRVALWAEVEPYYSDAKFGPGKARESRATEAVLNAFVLASNDSQSKHLDPTTRSAFDHAWALQLKSGQHAGAWDWQDFHMSPWESTQSQYQGAAFMALAVGWAPDHYRKDRGIQGNLAALRAYLRREYATQPLLNRIVVLWASGQFPGLLTKAEQHTLRDAILNEQHPDGGWSLAGLESWARLDHTPQETGSDGYATAVASLALRQVRLDRQQRNAYERGIAWLEQNQNKSDGSWRASSINKKRDPASDVGRFMTDAATGYAVLALAQNR